MAAPDNPDDDVAQLSDEELEAELTIAAASTSRDERYEQLLAERERRGGSA